jgi:hypothetical protein
MDLPCILNLFHVITGDVWPMMVLEGNLVSLWNRWFWSNMLWVCMSKDKCVEDVCSLKLSRSYSCIWWMNLWMSMWNLYRLLECYFKKKNKVSCAIEPLVGITSQECRTVRRLVMSVGITLYWRHLQRLIVSVGITIYRRMVRRHTGLYRLYCSWYIGAVV